MIESWKAIPEFEDRYEVSDLGRIRRTVTGRGTKAGRFRKSVLGGFRYLQVQLKRLDGRLKNITVHILVAGLFVPNPESKPEVNHKNGNRFDCRAENLEWVTHSENVQHAFDLGLTSKPSVEGRKRDVCGKFM